jgi:hypothetical protein
VIPTAPKSDLNLVAILVPSILGGLCLLGLLSALLCYCLKICCFEKKPIFKDIPYDNNTARRFVNNQPINTAPPQPITSFVPIAPVTPKPNFPPIVVTPPANLNV